MASNTARLSSHYYKMADQLESAYYQAARRKPKGSSSEFDKLVYRYYELERAYGQAARSLGGRGLASMHLQNRHAFIRNLFFPSSRMRTNPTRPASISRRPAAVHRRQQQSHQKIELSKLSTVPAEEASLEG